MSSVSRKRRGNSKYVRSSNSRNLHVIQPQLPPLPTSAEKKTFTKKVENPKLVTEKNESNLTNSSLNQDSKMSTVKKDRPDPGQQKKDVSNKNQKPHYLSNFLALSESVPSAPQEKKSVNFKNKFLSLQKVYESAGKKKLSPSKIAPQKVDKPIIEKGPYKMATPHVKKTPDPTKKIPLHHNLGDPDFMPQHLLSKTAVKKKLLFTKPDSLQQSKEFPYYESPFLTHKKDKLKARLGGSSKKSEIQNKGDSSFWKNERGSPRSSFPFDKETKLKKGPRSSKAYSSHDSEDESMYYNHKYGKFGNKKKDYKWQEKRKYHERSQYSWYNKDYAFNKKYAGVPHSSKKYAGVLPSSKKYAGVPHSSKKYLDVPQEERDFEELEDYEEVASIEDESKGSKVPVHFRKCMVRYLPYTIYSYFRPKWYYLSRKRYVVNCLYASERGRKVEESKLKLVNSRLEVPGGDFESDNELLEVVPDDGEEVIENVIVNDYEDVSIHDNEEVTEDVVVYDNEESSQDASVRNKEETIEDVSIHEKEETTEVVSVTGNEETTEDVSVHKNEETTKGVSVHDKVDDDLKKKSTPEKVVPVSDLCPDISLKSNKANKKNSSINAISDKTPKKESESIVNNTDIEIIDLEEETSPSENSETNFIQADITKHRNNKDLATISPRVFLKCISNLQFSPDFYQGDAAIQSSLCEWKSHLIGLEYMLEVRDNADETVIKKYHCGLCNQDLPLEKTMGQIVINHIINYTHMCNYAAKHFPSSDYKFSKSVRNCINEIVLQTCCEEINHKLGYHYMCIVKEHYFQNEYDKIKEHLSAMKHWDESNMDIYPTIINDQLESDTREDVACVLENMLDKISVGEPKETYFTPQTIVSSLRRSIVKDKKNDLSKISENTVNRCSQNTLIVLTPSPEAKAVNKSSLPSAEIKSPKKSVTSSVTPKPSKERSRSFNLLQVPVQDSKLHTDTQSSMTTSDQALDNDALTSATDMQSLQQRDSLEQEEVNPSENANIDRSLNVSDTETPFKFNAKKPFNFRKYRFKDSAPASSSTPEQSEKNSAVRIVRIRTSHNRPIPLGYDTDEEDQVGLGDRSMQVKESATSVENDPLNIVSDNTGAAEDLQGEDISDGDFPELEYVEVVSPGAEKTTPRSRSRNKQLHKKSAHSKYCHKRKMWIKGNSSDKESSLNDINPSTSTITTLGKTSKKYSNFMKKSDEFSQDSYASSTSKRKIRHRSSSSPSLEEFLRKLSPSPVRKRSKSPLRPYATYRKRGSMIRRHSRSPYRRHSRSPNKRHSRSPYRKRSRSPIRRRSRSPFKRRSRSPIRKRSRSPIRKRSRSPIRKRSRSPIRKRSRSPYRRHSRSPHRRHSRSPIRRRSRSPLWSASKGQSKRNSRSPFRKTERFKLSKSPEKASVKLPFHKYLKSPTRRSISPLSSYTRPKSPIRSDSRISEDSLKYRSDSLYKHSKDSTKSSGSYKSTSNLSVPHRHSETEMRKEVNDLEEISDEDESKYFNKPETPKYMEIIKNLPESARIMLVKVLQRFSITNVNPNDPSFYELMKFVASHSSEIQRLMSQPTALPEMSTPVQSNPTESFLHQYILSSMKASSQSEAIPSSSSIFPGSAGIHFQQPPGPSTSGLQHHAQRSSLPLSQFAQSVFQQPSSQPLFPVQSIHTTPPKGPQQQMFMNTSVTQQPPSYQPDAYRAVSPQKQVIPPQPKVTSEVMFKDLKATVSKIFGGDDALAKFGIKIPGFGGQPANEKYSSNPPSIPNINPQSQTSFHTNRSALGIEREAPTRVSDNLLKSYPKEGESYFSEAPRQSLHVPPPDAKVAFCDVQPAPLQRNLFPVVNNPETTSNYRQDNSQISVNDAKKSLAQRLASVLVKVGMTDVPAHLLQEMLMKIGAFSLNPPQDISEGEILGILRKLKYLKF